jgi:hypothetical protein
MTLFSVSCIEILVIEMLHAILYTSAFFRSARHGMLLRILKSRHLEVIRQLKVGLWVALERLKVDEQRVLDRKHGVIFYILAIAIEDLGDDGFVAGRRELRVLLAGAHRVYWDVEQTYYKVNMRRPVRVPVQCLQDLPCRSVIWNRIRHRSQAVKVVFSIFPCREPPS